MISDINKFVQFLADYKLTADEFLFMWLCHTKDWANIYKYVEFVGGFQPSMIRKLEDRGLVINVNKRGEYFADSFIVAEDFAGKAFSEDFEQCAQEFWDAYPSWLWIDGKKMPAKNWDMMAFEKFYVSKVKNTPGLHTRIMRALRYQTESSAGEINVGIEKCLKTDQYVEIEKDMAQAGSARQFGTQEFK